MNPANKTLSVEDLFKKLGEQFGIIRRQASLSSAIITGIDWGIDRDKKKRIIFEE